MDLRNNNSDTCVLDNNDSWDSLKNKDASFWYFEDIYNKKYYNYEIDYEIDYELENIIRKLNNNNNKKNRYKRMEILPTIME